MPADEGQALLCPAHLDLAGPPLSPLPPALGGVRQVVSQCCSEPLPWSSASPAGWDFGALTGFPVTRGWG